MTSQKFGSILIWVALTASVAHAQTDDNSIDPFEGIQKPVEITMTKKQIKNLCATTVENSDLILNYNEICKTPTTSKKKSPVLMQKSTKRTSPHIEKGIPTLIQKERLKQIQHTPIQDKQEVSTDNGKTWISLEQALMIGWGILGAGGTLVAGWLILRNRKKSQEKINERVSTAPYKIEPSFEPVIIPLGHTETEEILISWNIDIKDTPLILPPIKTEVQEAEKRPQTHSWNSEIRANNTRQLLLEKNLQIIEEDYEKTRTAAKNLYREVQKFIGEFPSHGKAYSIIINQYRFFWGPMKVVQEKTWPTTCRFKLTLGTKAKFYAQAQPFTDFREMQLFIDEKMREEYNLRYDKASTDITKGS